MNKYIKNFFILWLFFFGLISLYSNADHTFLLKLSLLGLIIVTTLMVTLGPNYKFNAIDWQNIIRKWLKKEIYVIDLKHLIFFLPFAAFIIANIFLLYFAIASLFNSINYSYVKDTILQINTLNAVGLLYHYGSILSLFISLITCIFFLYLLKKTKFIDEIKYLFSQNSKINFAQKRFFLLMFIVLIGLLYLIIYLGNNNILSVVSPPFNLLFFELNILHKIFSTFIYYFLLLILLYSLGRRLLSLTKPPFSSKLEDFILSFGLGMVLFVILIFILAITGYLYTITIWLLILAVLLFVLPELRKIITTIGNHKINIGFNTPYNSLQSITLFIIIILLIVNFLSIFKPLPIGYDDLHTYFNAPNLYVQNHGLIPFKYFSASNLSQNVELLYSAIIITSNTPMLMHISFVFFLLLLISSWVFVSRFWDKKIALLTLIIMFANMWHYAFTDYLKVDLALIFFCIIFIYTFLIYLKTKDHYYLILCAIFGGFAIGIKYNALFIVAPVFLILLAFLILQKNNIKSLIIWMFMIFLIVSPWLIKNTYYFNNPIYPYNQKIIQDNSPEFYLNNIKENVAQKINQEMIDMRYPYNSYVQSHELIKQIYIYTSPFFYGSNLIYGGSLIFLVLPLILLMRKNEDDKFVNFSILLFISCLGFVFWILKSYGQGWYMLPFMWIWGILEAVLIMKYIRQKHSIYPLIIIALLLIVAFHQNIKTSYNNLYIKLPYITGFESKQSFIKKTEPTYDIAKYINENISSNLNNKKILFLPTARLAQFKNNNITIIPDYWGGLFANIAANHPDQINTILKNLEIEYILFSYTRYNHIISMAINNGHPIEKSAFYNYVNPHKYLHNQLEKIHCSVNNEDVITYCLYKI